MLIQVALFTPSVPDKTELKPSAVTALNFLPCSKDACSMPEGSSTGYSPSTDLAPSQQAPDSMFKTSRQGLSEKKMQGRDHP